MRRGPVIVGLWLAIAGCGPRTEVPTGALVLDMTSQLGLAEVSVEAGLIDIGTAEARRFLGPGWSWNERGNTGNDLAWSSRTSSEIGFFLTGPRSLEIRFRCRPYRREDGSVEAVSISVNGHSAGTVSLYRGWREYSYTLPKEILTSGVNQMVFEYQWTTPSASRRDPNSGRQVAVAWDWIRFPAIEGGGQPHSPEPSILRLTRGSWTDFFFEAPGPTMLVMDEMEGSEDGDGLRQISVLRQGESEPEVLPMHRRSSRGPIVWPLTSEQGLARLRFEVDGDVELVRPQIRATGSTVIAGSAGRKPVDPEMSRVRPPLVLLYVIDTLRADRIDQDPAGFGDDPGLVHLAEDGVTFTDALAHSSWTKPATASILTGHLPWSHGAERSEDALSGKIPSLAQQLADLGFVTGAFSANGNVSSVFGFDHGFEHFSLMGQFDAPASQVQRQALQWLDERDSSRETFLYVHTIDPHAPYVSTDRFFSATASDSHSGAGTVPFMRRLAKSRQKPEAELIRELSEMYDQEVATSQRELGQMLRELDRRDLYRQALVVVVSDHGEEFYDHGQWTHGRNLHKATLQVPLLIKFPDNWAAGTRVETTTQQIDILPTILDYLGKPLQDVPGSSLLPAIHEALDPARPGLAESSPRPVFASVHYHNNHWVGVVLGDWKLMLRGTERLNRQAQLFNRRLDPDERQNLAHLDPVRVGYLASLIRAEIEHPGIENASRPVELDAETRERLEALGYLN